MLEVHRLSKSFRLPRRARKRPEADPRERAGLFHALAPVSFRAPAGRIIGVLGPNGAGKTTLLRVLATALRPSSGTATVGGHDIVKHPTAVRRRMGFLSGTTGLYGRLTPREMLDYYGRLHGLRGRGLRQRVDALLQRVDLQPHADRRNDTLSTGLKQRVSIARTLLHDPALLVFDEPTTGLDVAAAETIVDLMATCRDEGKAILLSTHHMHEVERLCDMVLILRQGRLCYQGSVPEMLAHTGHERLDRAFLSVLETTEVSRAA